MTTGYSNKRPRRGTPADAKLRRHFLKKERTKLPRRRDLERLRIQAEKEMGTSNAKFERCTPVQQGGAW